MSAEDAIESLAAKLKEARHLTEEASRKHDETIYKLDREDWQIHIYILKYLPAITDMLKYLYDNNVKRSVESDPRMSSALDKASERATVAERRVAQLEDELAKKSSILANKVKCFMLPIRNVPT